MLYAEDHEQTQNFLFGMWANSYFFTPGRTTAYTYGMNEDAYMSLWNDQTVCTKIPVQLIDSVAAAETSDSSLPDGSSDVSEEESSSESEAEVTDSAEEASSSETSEEITETSSEESSEEEASSEEAPAEQSEDERSSAEESETERSSAEESETERSSAEESETEGSAAEGASAPQPSAEEAPTEEPAEVSSEEAETPSETENVNARYIDLTMLTPRDGLPETAAKLTGVNGDPFMFEYTERTQRSDRVNKYQASVFGGKAGIALIAGGAAAVGAAAFVIYKKLSGNKPAPKNTPAVKKTAKNTPAHCVCSGSCADFVRYAVHRSGRGSR